MTVYGIVGCGYAASFYAANILIRPDDSLYICYDTDDDRAMKFANFYGIHKAQNMKDLFDCDCILNITNPQSHYQVSNTFLSAGIPVFSEKPFALNLNDARDLVATSLKTQTPFGSAPGVLFNPAFLKLVELAQSGDLGRPLLIRASIHEGPVPRMLTQQWASDTGAQWPKEEEFRLGCVIEHSAYAFDLVSALWGSWSRATYQKKRLNTTHIENELYSPDWTTVNLHYSDGRLAVVNLSIVEPEDHSFQVLYENALIRIEDIWDFNSKLQILESSKSVLERPRDYLNKRREIDTGRSVKIGYRDGHQIDQISAVESMLMAEGILDIYRSLNSLEATLKIASGPMEGSFEMESKIGPMSTSALQRRKKQE
jgi:predicted dehydrogenase